MTYDEYTYVESSTYRQGKSSKANRLVANIALNDKYLKHQYYETVQCRCWPNLGFKKNTPGNFPFVVILCSIAMTVIYILTFVQAVQNLAETDKNLSLNQQNNPFLSGNQSEQLITQQTILSNVKNPKTLAESLTEQIETGRFSVLTFQPKNRIQAWRYVSYWLLHGNIAQITCNLILMLVLGIPLELVHGSVRVGVLYFLGIVTGSMFALVLNIDSVLIGATSGVYSLVFAWLITTIVNADSIGLMRTLCRLFPVILIIVFDTFVEALVFTQESEWSTDILQKFGACDLQVSYAGYVAGAAVGMSLGSCLLKNFADPMFESLSHKAVSLFWLMLLTGCVLCQIVPITLGCHGKISLGFTEIAGTCSTNSTLKM